MFHSLGSGLNIVPPLIGKIVYFLANNISLVPSLCFHLKLQFVLWESGKKSVKSIKWLCFQLV